VALEAVFWLSVLLVAHTYLLYPVFLAGACGVAQLGRDWKRVRGRERGRPDPAAPELPPVTFLIPAYNEEARLNEKLANLRALDYPADRLRVIFVSDGSTDRTDEILAGIREPHIETVRLPVRSGKATALNRAVELARTEILVFSDAATLFEATALRRLVSHFADPTVGVVCGALDFRASAESRQTEGVYWSYESMLRRLEGRLGATLTASGAIYAIRRRCYPGLDADVIVEDLVIPMHARGLGYRVVYDPEARATDFAAPTVAGEFTRRVRVAVGSFRALPRLIATRVDALTAFALFSHKLLRWILPFPLLALLVSSACLAQQPFYRAALAAQLLFYLWAGLGLVFRHRIQGVRFALLAYYLLAIHLAYLVGLMRCLAGRRETTWQRVG
jgi:cellulose synthase/poly-beta-1,6-N-acetylglucosamine synthase-like glycosyltransferase